jgi:putative copper resistance protein D
VTWFVVDPGVILTVLIAELLYLRALRILAGRGVSVPLFQKVMWHCGISLWVIGLLSPIGTLGEQLLSAHMAEHLLIADIAAPLLLIGIRNPVLAFLLPRPALVTVARAPRLRRVFRVMRRPLVAIPIYAGVLYFWHFSFAFEAAMKYPVVHALQHMSFISTAILVWWSAIEPKRRRVPGELWKISHILGARMLGMFLGMGYVIVRTPIYTSSYSPDTRTFGLTALADQQLAGALMVSVDIVLMVFALGFFFFRSAQDYDRKMVVAEQRS